MKEKKIDLFSFLFVGSYVIKLSSVIKKLMEIAIIIEKYVR